MPIFARASAALLVAAAGALHLYLWFYYFDRVHVVGTLFLANAGAGIALAVTLVATHTVFAQLAALGYSVGTLVAFAISTEWGLFGYHERFWGAWQEAAGGVELTATVLLVGMLTVARGSSGGRGHSPAARRAGA